MAAVIGSINVDGGKGGTDVSGREWEGGGLVVTRLAWAFFGPGAWGLSLSLSLGVVLLGGGVAECEVRVQGEAR
jgi:hypothetical protein